MPERFTDWARRAIRLAGEESSRLDSGHVGTEHLLLGLIRVESGIASTIVTGMGVSLGKVRAEVLKRANKDPEMILADIPPSTTRAQNVLKHAKEKAGRSSHLYIGTEHLLFGLLREPTGMACSILLTLGVLEGVREKVSDFFV